MKDIIVKPKNSIRQAMKKLTNSGEKCLVIVDKKNILLGTLSDGDLRKAILKGNSMTATINDIYQQKPTVLVKGKYRIEDAKQLFTQNKFDIIPVVDENGKLSDVLFWGTVFENNENKKIKNLNVPVVIMAGGKGSRLEPFTKILPKPLVPIEEKPIIEHIIERFTILGCSDFHLMVNYKGGIIKAYFEELQPDYSLQFIEETEPLGTVGSLHFLDGKFNQPFFLTNCDIIIKADYVSLYEFHQKGNYDITLVASDKEFIIPYGTCELNRKGDLSQIIEKPQYDFLINTGLYVLNPDVLKLIPKNRLFHTTHLIESVKDQGKKVGVFPIGDEAWIDVGQWAEYKNYIDKL